MAAHASTTFGAAPPDDPLRVAAHAPLSITALGFELVGVKRRLREVDEAEAKSPQATGTCDGNSTTRTLWARAEALENAIAAMPAENLTEATIQIAAAVDMASIIDSGDFRDPEAYANLTAIQHRVFLLTLSALPVFAAAAGLDEKTMGWEDNTYLRDRYFFGRESDA